MNNNSVIDQLKSLELEAIEAINNVQTEHNLNEVKASYLGKKSKLQEIMSKMKDLSIEEKKELGKNSNEFKVKVESVQFLGNGYMLEVLFEGKKWTLETRSKYNVGEEFFIYINENDIVTV